MIDIFPDGDGIFETILTRSNEPLLLNRHIARAQRSALYLGLAMPSAESIRGQVNMYLQNNPLASEFGRLRITFPGGGELGIVHTEYQKWIGPAKLTCDISPIDESSPLAGIKALPYRRNLEILARARGAGFDDAVRPNQKGEVCETSVANLLLRHAGIWITPTLESGALPGITRALAIEWFHIVERDLMIADLQNVDSIFLLSSLRGFQPAASLDGRSLEIETGIAQKAAALGKALSVE